MPKAIGVKIPEPLLLRIEALMTKEDKDNRNAMLCELLDMALTLREAGRAASGAGGQHKFDELVETCNTRITLQMNRMLCEILRFTYDNARSKFPDCKDANALLKHLSQLAQQTVDEYKGVAQTAEV